MKRSLLYMYYTHRGYQTSIFGKKNCAYYIQIFMVLMSLPCEAITSRSLAFLLLARYVFMCDN